MRNFLLAFMLAGIGMTGAQAESYLNLDGTFSAPGADLKVIVLDSDKGIVAASSNIVLGACAGEISGLGKIKGKTILIEPYVKEEGGEKCVLRAEFDAAWKRVKLIEGDYCTYYHGASCGWEGQQLKRKGK